MAAIPELDTVTLVVSGVLAVLMVRRVLQALRRSG